MNIEFVRESECTASVWWSAKQIGMITVDPGHGEALDQLLRVYAELDDCLCQLAHKELISLSFRDGTPS
jgi:hypothetical protein